MNYHNIIFFDGYCILCNKFIDLFLDLDKSKHLYYTPLTSNYAQKILSGLDITEINSSNIDTVIYLKDKKIFLKSDAIIEIIKELGGVYKASILLYVVPQIIRNWCYDLVAENRYSLFGKMKECRTISPEERSRILE